jgi:hypothetical protein
LVQWGTVTFTMVVYVALALALLIGLWPTEQSGRRFLTRWGIAFPTGEQGLAAAGYLRSRRLLYLLLFATTPPAVAALFRVLGQSDSASGTFRLLTPLVVALLVAEVVAALRQVRGPRVAVLAPRSWRDLVPVWALALLFGLAVLALGLGGLGLAAQPWADRYAAVLPRGEVPQPPTDFTVHVPDSYRTEITHSTSWIALAGTLLCLAAVLGLVRLAVRRHAVADPQVDTILRARTARVAVGIGMGWLASMTMVAVNRLGFVRSLTVAPVPGRPEPPGWLDTAYSLTRFLGLVLILVVAAGWIWVANPPRRAGNLAAIG